MEGDELPSDALTVHHYDARAIGQLLDSIATAGPAVTTTVTSPPYFNLLDYGGTPNQVGHGQRYAEYLADCKSVFAQLFARTTDQGSLWLIADTMLDQTTSPSRLRNIPFDLARECESAGWTLRDVIIWHKDKTRPWSNAGRLRNSFEYVLFFVKTSSFNYRLDRIREPNHLAQWWVKYPERYNPRGKAPENLWHFPIPSQGSWANTSVRHACPLPPDLIERILLLSTDEGDLVCDPFAGSGTVIAEALRLRRKGIGTELNDEYVRAYNSVVRPEILTRRAVTDIEKLSKESADLEATINQLRAVKYAKSVWHALRKQATDSPMPSHVIAYASQPSNQLTSHHLQDVALTFVLDAQMETRERTAAAIKALVTAPPLTKYGISGDIAVVSPCDASTRFHETSLWLYEHGETWDHQGPVEVSAFLALKPSRHRMHYPPIASNVAVKVVPPSAT